MVAPAVSVIIPCLNEESALRRLLPEVQKHVRSVIVVDDGSTDGTGRFAASCGAEVIQHKLPLGKGQSLREGVERARSKGVDWALVMDGDGQHWPGDIPRFLEALERAQVDLVVGNRMDDSQVMPWVRRSVNRWMSRRISRLTGHFIPDSQCGFRLIRLARWPQLGLQSTNFEIESEMIVNLICVGGRVAHIPVRVIYAGERSKIRAINDTVRWFRWWRKARQAFSMRRTSLSMPAMGVSSVSSA